MEREMTMVERCAKAIYEKRNGPGCTPWSRQKKVHQAPYLHDARAAIEAMREMTPPMEHAAYEEMPAYREHDETDALYAAKWYGCIIDAALKEQEGEKG